VFFRSTGKKCFLIKCRVWSRALSEEHTFQRGENTCQKAGAKSPAWGEAREEKNTSPQKLKERKEGERRDSSGHEKKKHVDDSNKKPRRHTACPAGRGEIKKSDTHRIGKGKAKFAYELSMSFSCEETVHLCGFFGKYASKRDQRSVSRSSHSLKGEKKMCFPALGKSHREEFRSAEKLLNSAACWPGGKSW